MQLCESLTRSPNMLPRKRIVSHPQPRLLAPRGFLRHIHQSACSLRPNLLKGHRIAACIGLSRDAAPVLELEVEDETIVVVAEEELREQLSKQGLWNQMKKVAKFAGPATGLWVCGPLMSLIDTAVIGRGSSLELAALGPGTVICDYMGYWFMFLSIATSNMVATSLAGQIRGLAWPAVMLGCIAQSASLGMKDSWGPLKALAVATAVNGIGDVVLCSVLHFGIAGAAWATTVSQVVAAYMMIASLKDKGYNAFALSVPSTSELFLILGIAAPFFITKTSRVAFYALLIYFATSMGTVSAAAHQVMIQTYGMGTVWGEPLSQTAQSFMPELIYGVNRSPVKARALLKSLFIVGLILGLMIASIGAVFPWWFPNIFTSDPAVTQEMHKVLIPFFIALSVTPPTQSLEGTLLAGRDLKFICASMSGCFTLGALLLLARFWLALRRLASPNSILYAEDLRSYKVK
ncbi:hypothetical protein CRG98_041016 [Punica granatum]|uniref:Uncharacterized protein n=1 Tax=Punica granatum TaxID=22663 RepID=A0A2I0I416_PUNGR|nr:hypothetical protein CRG98_041016 [Punica granatum]